jgi:hypothetical protein
MHSCYYNVATRYGGVGEDQEAEIAIEEGIEAGEEGYFFVIFVFIFSIFFEAARRGREEGRRVCTRQGESPRNALGFDIWFTTLVLIFHPGQA